MNNVHIYLIGAFVIWVVSSVVLGFLGWHKKEPLETMTCIFVLSIAWPLAVPVVLIILIAFFATGGLMQLASWVRDNIWKL